MASPAHCFYCFECLSASFGGTQPPKLSVIEDLWEEFESSIAVRSGEETLEDEDEAGGTPGRDCKAGVGGDDNNRDKEPHNGRNGQKVNDQPTDTPPETLKLPSISRLQEPSASLRSSNSSTPSALSTSSSHSILSNSTGVTSPSSPPTPSYFSQSKPVATQRYLKSSQGTTYPLFVTWNAISRSGHKVLRGCIGTFEGQELVEGLKSYALTSAFGDTRFSPIPVHLLPSLSCSLTLLSSFETCAHPLEWDLGTHGLRISFIHRGRRHGATYLPDVAVEQGWTKEETLESLMRKAGWDGYAGSGGGVSRRFLRGSANNANRQPWEQVSEFKTVRYQGLKASADYGQWQEWRKWAKTSATGRGMIE